MSLPGYSAEVSIYRTTTSYYQVWAGRGASSPQAGPVQPMLPPLPNGNGCKPHFGPCTIKDPDCPSGTSRLVCGTDCECDTVCCPPTKKCQPCNAQGFQTCCVGSVCTTQACTSCGPCQHTCCTGGNCSVANC